jgi:hypothetical protein
MTRTHATGSATSYGSRYLLRMIFNISIGEDDGNLAGGEDHLISVDQVQTIRDLIERTKADPERFCKYLGCESIPMLHVKDYERAIIALNTKAKKL